MLKVFRNNLQHLKWVLWVVVIIFVSFIFFDFGAGLGGGPNSGGPNVAAWVGDEEVTVDEFERSYRNLEGMYRQVYGERFTPELARQMGLPMQALNQAVSQEILLEEARKMGLAATDDEVRDRILQDPSFKDEQGRFIGEERYRELLRGARYGSPAMFEAEIRDQITVQKLMDILEANLYVSDKEVEQAYRDQVERARIRYVQLPRTRFLQNTAVPPAEVQAYFEKHKQEYRLPEQREGAYLLVDPAQLASQVKIDEKRLRDYYDQNQQEFERPEQVHARHVLIKTEGRSDAEAQKMINDVKARLAKGEAFEAVARQASEEPAAKTTGGDLGWFGRGQMVPAFEQAVFGAQKGTLVGPLKTQFGYHVIEILDKRAAGTQPFAEVRESIQQRLAAERTQEMAEAKARELAKKLAADKPGNADAVKALAAPDQGVTFAETGPFSKQEPVSGLGFAPAFTTAAFALEKGGVSEAIQVPRGWVVFYLKDVKAPRVPELKDVQPRVQAAVARDKQQEMAINQLKQAMTPGKTLDQIAAELNLEVKESSEFGTQGQIPGIGANPELAKAAMTLPTGKVGGPIGDAQGAILFEVKERKSWDPIQFAGAREETRETVRRTKLNEIEASLIESRRRALDVRFDPVVLEQFGITSPDEQPNPAG